MAYGKEAKETVLTLLQRKVTAKEINRLTGVSIATINNWKKEAGLTKKRKENKDESQPNPKPNPKPDQVVGHDEAGTQQEEYYARTRVRELTEKQRKTAELQQALKMAKQKSDRVECIRNFRTTFRN